MKYCSSYGSRRDGHVAPLVGARIEIKMQLEGIAAAMSLPSWERGLKFQRVNDGEAESKVAPLVGARIEM